MAFRCKVLTRDEARRIAANAAKLPEQIAEAAVRQVRLSGGIDLLVLSHRSFV